MRDPQRCTSEVSSDALERFLRDLSNGLRLAVNNRLACEFVGGAASWDTCRDIMNPRGNWDNQLAKLLALPKAFARNHHGAIDDLFQMSGMESSWGPMDDDAVGATVKVAIDHPGGDSNDLDMEPSHALAFLTITLNHKDGTGKSAAPSAGVRERELVEHMKAQGKEPPEALASVPTSDARARRAVTAIWVIGEIWRLADEDRDEAQDLLDAIVGRDGLVGLWIEGNDSRTGLASQIRDISSDILRALRERFTTYLSGRPAQVFDMTDTPKRCILCNEPVDRQRRHYSVPSARYQVLGVLRSRRAQRPPDFAVRRHACMPGLLGGATAETRRAGQLPWKQRSSPAHLLSREHRALRWARI